MLGMPSDPLPPSAFDDSPPRRSTEHWVVLGIALSGAVALLLFALFLEPDARGYGTHERLGLKPCYPMLAWNFPCPGCGVTTSVASAARGDLLDSFVAQPFGLLLALLAVVFVLWAVAGQLRGRDLWVDLHTRDWFPLVVVLITAMAASWIYKIAAVRGWFG